MYILATDPFWRSHIRYIAVFFNVSIDTLLIKVQNFMLLSLIDSWCQPCKMLAPKLTAVMEGAGNKVDFAKVDIDELTDIAMEYGVRLSIYNTLYILNSHIINWLHDS